jgi:hypothetical protein
MVIQKFIIVGVVFLANISAPVGLIALWSDAQAFAQSSDSTQEQSAKAAEVGTTGKGDSGQEFADKEGDGTKQIDWSKLPTTIHSMPRTGIFQVPPTTKTGYYSLWDYLLDQERAASPKTGYSNTALNQFSFFDSDWRYVDSLAQEDRTWVERLKRMRVGERFMLSVGGSYWIRSMNENNSRLTRTTNDYTLNRIRTYADVTYKDAARVYGEYLWCDSFGEELAPLITDANRGDILNLFVDLKVFEVEDKPVFVRGGRQELLYGSQRLIAPVEWSNTRRTFDGLKIFRQGAHWDIDAFWMQPVIPRAGAFDQADHKQNFSGLWTTRRREKGEFFDLYYLNYSNSNSLVQAGIDRAPTSVNTFGTRLAGNESGFLWDFETMLQVGEKVDRDLVAAAATAGIGYTWQESTWSPTLWTYYDYASGDSDPNSGSVHTFNQLFPFGHYYMGWMDLVGRQNIHDANLHCYLYPAPWITLWSQYHHFWLDQAKDALYGPSGSVMRRDATGNSGTNVGDEIGLFANLHLTRYSDFMASYNKLYGGGFLEATAGANQSADADSLYLMFQQRW